MAKKKIGLLLMAYGTPRKREDIERYYTHIRHGHKPTEEMLEDLKSRYEAIGGLSPLAETTEQQAAGLEQEMNQRYADEEVVFKAYLGLKHIEPFIEDAVEAMKADGVDEAISLVLAPHYSTFSVKAYNERAQQKTKAINGPTIHAVNDWYAEPTFIAYWQKQLEATFADIPEAEKSNTVVVFSAHSLPEKILQDGDPYPEQLKQTANLIADKSQVTQYAIGWQSEGNTPDPWLGPDVQDLTRSLYHEQGYRSFIYCPVGFVAEHLEVLYDNDYECKVVCDELGAAYYRPDMPNAKPEFINILATVVVKTWEQVAVS